MADTGESLSHIVLADISGYTRFMRANATTLRHANYIVSELLAAVIRQVRPPMRPAKLEGDAVLFVAPLEVGGDTDHVVRRSVAGFFDAFDRRRAELMAENTCPCESCTTVHRLDLKVISHFGQVLRYKLQDFDELAGLDVIIAHRLLKNSVGSSRYLLASQPAWERIRPVDEPEVDRHVEDCEGVGEVEVVVLLGGWPGTVEPHPPDRASLARRFADFFVKHWMLLPFGRHMVRQGVEQALRQSPAQPPP